MHKWKAILFAGAASVFLIQPAQAQSEGESAPAADGADRQGGLGEIVVTARRQEERLQDVPIAVSVRSEEHTSELQSIMRISYAVFCLKKKKTLTYNKKEQQPSVM